MRAAVFLDRDGVLNRAVVVDGRPRPPASAGELQLEPGAEAACRRLKAAGLRLFVVTNQPDLARGGTTPEEVSAINSAIRQRLPIDAIYLCPHDDADGCGCRKPAPGLLLQAAAEHGIDVAVSVMVGDRWRDVEAGRRAGCATVFVDHGYSERRPEAPDLTVGSLDEAVDWIVARTAADGGG